MSESDSYHHPLVRDLAWLIEAPDIVSPENASPALSPLWAGRPTLAELGLESSATRARWLAARERHPAHLEQAIGTAVSARMGHYHERLWHYLLEHAPGTRLLASNIRIIERRITLGELDMVYRTCHDPALVHLEVAIKFYLGLPEGPGAADSQSRWIGPGGLDSLAIKRDHMQRRQLPLSATPAAHATLRHWLAPRDTASAEAPLALTQRLAMPGVLFYPFHAELPAPTGANPHHLRGTWVRWGDWPKFMAQLPAATQGALLDKPHWLAPPHPSRLCPLTELLPALHRHFARTDLPLQMMVHCPFAASSSHALAPESNWQRIFLVADDWPNRIPLPPGRNSSS
ncbi:DUF1853 family protein [Halomonas sp. Bachu 37]|uniref:DUF1853 family protein n=1 Tax=Halomonas kashgarensis TaxID=3084920 RepID=UPI00321787C6